MDLNDTEIKVIKRGGEHEDVSFDKILTRVRRLNNMEPALQVNCSPLVLKVIDQLYNNIPTTVIDELTAQQCASLCTKHPDYEILASRIIISNHHKNTPNTFYEAMEKLYNFKDVNGYHSPLISHDMWNIINLHKDELNSLIDCNRDYLFDYFGFKTLERAYLMKSGKNIVERPQYMWLRVSLGIHGKHPNMLENVKKTYNFMSKKYFTHATPTLFNSGTPRPQLSSCFLLAMEEDSIDGIYNTLHECASISKWAGGIGLHIHNIRSTGTHIRGTNGISNGIVPMLRVFNMTARYVDQGGGKRNGSFAIYLEPWHADIQDFLELKKNHGDEEMRARDLFYALWIPSLFMEKVKNNEDWCLFCPDQSPGLADCYGEEFNRLYSEYEQQERYVKKVKAREIWFAICDSQMETGTPYLLYKDSANEKSNQKNLGTIKSSNLCTEIIEYSNKDQTAVCNLASIGLTMFVADKKFDFELLHEVVGIITDNLNKIIDVNYYPIHKTRVSNLLHRPIGIGVQGLADVFALMDIPYHSEEAKQLNKNIFETIYHSSLSMSNKLAKDRLPDMEQLNKVSNFDYNIFATDSNVCQEYNTCDPQLKKHVDRAKPIPGEMNRGKLSGSYSSFEGSPASTGILQFDMWNVKPSNRYNWTWLKNNIKTYGLRNSLLVAPMPTASTSQILGNNECFEPFTSNIYTRRTLAGEFTKINKYLMKELIDIGMWNSSIKDNIILNKGSIQQIQNIPQKIKDKYKIAWEIPPSFLIDMAADRGAYICQSQSLNIWVEDPDYKSLTNIHFNSWKKGLKTGIYYLRRKPKHQPQQFTLEPSTVDEPCETCSS